MLFQRLKRLEPILGAEVETNSIIVLRKECSSQGAKMPSFKTLSSDGPSGEQIVTVQCTALSHTAVGKSARPLGGRETTSAIRLGLAILAETGWKIDRTQPKMKGKDDQN